MCAWCATGNMHTRSAPDTCVTGKPITRSAPHMRYGYFFTSGMLPAVHGICAMGSHIRCATGKLFLVVHEAHGGDDIHLATAIEPVVQGRLLTHHSGGRHDDEEGLRQ
jgi:hypothetical protein